MSARTNLVTKAFEVIAAIVVWLLDKARIRRKQRSEAAQEAQNGIDKRDPSEITASIDRINRS